MLEKLPPVVGAALSGVRAGLDQIAFNTLGLRQGLNAIELGSLAFADHAPMPARYTADGEGLSPPLYWRAVPPGTASLVLLVEDADSPTPHPLVHAIVVDLAPADGALGEGEITTESPGAEPLPAETRAGLPDHSRRQRVGRNSMLLTAWLPPDPPPGHGVHRYAFQIFALAGQPDWSPAPGRDEVLDALRQHASASGLLIGCYERDRTIKLRDSVPVPSR